MTNVKNVERNFRLSNAEFVKLAEDEIDVGS